MCFWPIVEVELEEPPPKKEEKEEKKEEKPDYILASDQINLQPVAAPAGIHYPEQPNVQFYAAQPAAEPMNINVYPGPRANGGGDNAQAHHASGGQAAPAQAPIQLVPQTANPNQQLYCRELDGTYTLQTVNKIMHDLQPGYWKKSTSGFPYWVRTAKG
ncbi:hypothetical protein ACLMJK_001217 [Lecanora helva]